MNKQHIILFSLVLVFLIHLQLHAQLFNISLEREEISFNKNFIRDHKVKSIKTAFASKPDHYGVIDLKLTKGYEFDSTGKIVYTYSAQSQKNENQLTADTTATWFFYDKEEKMIGKRSNNGVFYNTYYYEYDDRKRIKKETHCRETNANLNGGEFKLGVQLILSQETFQYDSLTPTQYKKRCFNDEQRIYKEGIMNTDKNGNIIEENYRFVVGWVKLVNQYKYDISGRVIEKIYQSNENNDIKEQSIYEYDNIGNLIAEKKYKNGVQTHEMSYLYDDENKFIKSLITRYYLENKIGIVKYSYDFYK